MDNGRKNFHCELSRLGSSFSAFSRLTIERVTERVRVSPALGAIWPDLARMELGWIVQ